MVVSANIFEKSRNRVTQLMYKERIRKEIHFWSRETSEKGEGNGGNCRSNS